MSLKYGTYVCPAYHSKSAKNIRHTRVCPTVSANILHILQYKTPVERCTFAFRHLHIYRLPSTIFFFLSLGLPVAYPDLDDTHYGTATCNVV